MDYRDSLDAALARIAALEAELAGRESPEQPAQPDLEVELQAVRRHRDDLQAKLAIAQKELAVAKKQLAISEKRLSETLGSIQETTKNLGRGMKTLYEHNLKQAPLEPRDDRQRAKVACPRCAAEAGGASVEMMTMGLSMNWGSSRMVSAVCPRCAFTGYVRQG